VGTSCAGSQSAVFQPFDTLQALEKVLNFGWPSPHGYNLKAVVVIKVDVLGGNNGFMAVVLHICKSLKQFPLVVVIHEHDCADNFRAPLPLGLHQNRPHKIRHRFRACGTPVGFDLTIKFGRKVGVNRNTKSHYRHDMLPREGRIALSAHKDKLISVGIFTKRAENRKALISNVTLGKQATAAAFVRGKNQTFCREQSDICRLTVRTCCNLWAVLC